MPFRDHWNRMLGKSASSAVATPSLGASRYPAFPALSSSAPTSPTGGVTIASYTWPTSSSKSSSTTCQQQHQPELQPQQQAVTLSSPTPPQQQQPPKPKTKRRSKKSPSCHCSAARMHPSERPLTDENLRHQEMFANYTLTFGRSGSGSDSSSTSSSSSGRYSFDGEISPCSSRRGSLIDPRSATPFV